MLRSGTVGISCGRGSLALQDDIEGTRKQRQILVTQYQSIGVPIENSWRQTRH